MSKTYTYKSTVMPFILVRLFLFLECRSFKMCIYTHIHIEVSFIEIKILQSHLVLTFIFVKHVYCQYIVIKINKLSRDCYSKRDTPNICTWQTFKQVGQWEEGMPQVCLLEWCDKENLEEGKLWGILWSWFGEHIWLPPIGPESEARKKACCHWLNVDNLALTCMKEMFGFQVWLPQSLLCIRKSSIFISKCTLSLCTLSVSILYPK